VPAVVLLAQGVAGVEARGVVVGPDLRAVVRLAAVLLGLAALAVRGVGTFRDGMVAPERVTDLVRRVPVAVSAVAVVPEVAARPAGADRPAGYRLAAAGLPAREDKLVARFLGVGQHPLKEQRIRHAVLGAHGRHL